MNNSVQSKKSALPVIAAAFFAVCAIDVIIFLYKTVSWAFDSYSDVRWVYIKLFLLYFINLSFLVLAVVFLFLRKPLFIGISFAGLAFSYLSYFISNAFDGAGVISFLSNFLAMAAFVLAALMFFTMKDGVTPMRVIWFLPTILLFIGNIYYIIVDFKYIFSEFKYLSIDFWRVFGYIFSELFYITVLILQPAALLFAGLWIAGNSSAGSANNDYYVPEVPVEPYYIPPVEEPVYQPAVKPDFIDNTTVMPQPQDDIPVQNSVVDVERELVSLKNLLDKGIITEEEFAAKKKQLLDFI